MWDGIWPVPTESQTPSSSIQLPQVKIASLILPWIWQVPILVPSIDELATTFLHVLSSSHGYPHRKAMDAIRIWSIIWAKGLVSEWVTWHGIFWRLKGNSMMHPSNLMYLTLKWHGARRHFMKNCKPQVLIPSYSQLSCGSNLATGWLGTLFLLMANQPLYQWCLDLPDPLLQVLHADLEYIHPPDWSEQCLVVLRAILGLKIVHYLSLRTCTYNSQHNRRYCASIQSYIHVKKRVWFIIFRMELYEHKLSKTTSMSLIIVAKRLFQSSSPQLLPALLFCVVLGWQVSHEWKWAPISHEKPKAGSCSPTFMDPILTFQHIFRFQTIPSQKE